MKRNLFILLACFVFSVAAVSQPVVFVNAGSRASRGNYQELMIDGKGNCRYRLHEVNGPVRDSSSFTIPQLQLDSFFRRAEQSGFFTLNNIYNGNTVDGAGIYISINSSGKKHAVQVINTDQPVINELVTMLNRLLEPRRVRINYGQFVTK